MADTTEETPVEETAPVAQTFGTMKKSTRVYDATAIETIVEQERTAAIAREQAVEAKITAHRTDTDAQITVVDEKIDTEIAQTKQEFNNKIDNITVSGGGIKYCGVLDTMEELNAITDAQHGHFYIVTETNKTYIWTVPPQVEGEEPVPGYWKEMSTSVDLSNYYTKSEVYSKAEVDVIRARALKNEQKLARIIAAWSGIKSVDPIQGDEYILDEVIAIVNQFLIAGKAIAGILDEE